ncbi:MAG TPA: DUF1345 domain-containing protein [Pseudolabrys sp.]|nr:DUF1345 domain-containing protein [Pseudolabrys sp.]
MASKPHQPGMLVRLAHLHARLLISIAVGVLLPLALVPADWRTPTRLLAGWDAGVALYLVLVHWVLLHATVGDIRRRAAIQDEGALALLLLSGAAAIASLVAIVFEIAQSPSVGAWRQLAVGMGTIVLSWLFMNTMFALHYAHEYYGERSDDRIGGLKFPGTQGPDYWDFLYFSFVIAMTCQVSDVAITSKVIRRVVTIQGVLAFFFNLAILALTINMISNLVKPG